MVSENPAPQAISSTVTTGITKGLPLPSTSRTNNHGYGSGNSSRSNSLESTSNAPIKPHTGGDVRWEAINMISKGASLDLKHFRILKRIGYGDIGSVYLVELKKTKTYFAMKIMKKEALISRNKLLRAQTEREILQLLDHPFLPTLYSYFENDKVYCLVMEFCSGGNLHSLHMLGIVYRDLKPENVLVRDEGHIMLSDFDLSLRCSVNPTLIKSSSVHASGSSNGSSSGSGVILEDQQTVQTQPSTFFPRILAPEIIRGEGHGSAVDWWTFGIFLYELLHGTTPFKGAGNRATLSNVVGQPLRFPDTTQISSAAKDLIKGLLVKEPPKRIAYIRGAPEIKQHPFFEGVNWALVRSALPPHIPDPVDFTKYASNDTAEAADKVIDIAKDKNAPYSPANCPYMDFEYF